jgi:hypothetical protein
MPTIIVYLAPGEDVPDAAPDLSSHWEEASASMTVLGEFARDTSGRDSAQWAAFATSDGTVIRMVAGAEGRVTDLFQQILEELRGDLSD